MRHLFKLLLLLIFTISCKAQQPIYDNPNYGDEDGVYYKDLDNDFNRFEGTWVYTNGTTSLEIQFVKKTNMHIQDLGDNFYTDALVGEYKYIQFGSTVVNTLMNLSANHSNPYEYNIIGDYISKYGDPLCGDLCNPNDIVITGGWGDPERDIEGSSPEFYMRHYEEDGVEKIYIRFKDVGNITINNGEPQEHTTYRLPLGVYTLTKQ